MSFYEKNITVDVIDNICQESLNVKWDFKKVYQ